MNEDDHEAGAQRMPVRITRALGVPGAPFHRPDEAVIPVVCADPREIELVRLLPAIRTDEDRQRGLSPIRAIVSRR